MYKKLPAEYFQSEETLTISQNLLGMYLISTMENKVTAGMIVETEAYLGAEDRACHAFGQRRSKRTEVMYLPGGHWYVYLCYGIHSLVNIVTHRAEEPHAILIRAIEPSEGINHMLQRRKMHNIDYRLTSGPGSLSMALGITTNLTGEPIGTRVWIEDRGVRVTADQIISSPRVGVSYAKEHALLPYRFQLNDNPWVTR